MTWPNASGFHPSRSRSRGQSRPPEVRSTTDPCSSWRPGSQSPSPCHRSSKSPAWTKSSAFARCWLSSSIFWCIAFRQTLLRRTCCSSRERWSTVGRPRRSTAPPSTRPQCPAVWRTWPPSGTVRCSSWSSRRSRPRCSCTETKKKNVSFQNMFLFVWVGRPRRILEAVGLCTNHLYKPLEHGGY